MPLRDLFNLNMSLLCVALCFVLGLCICRIRSLDFQARAAQRLGHVDGLRGYLALLVFVHHFVIMDRFRATGRWSSPPEDYFNNFGVAGVALFFMITGYLFIHRILASRHGIDWLELLRARIFRIYPLYLTAFVVVVGVAAHGTQFELREPLGRLAGDLAKWLFFLGGTINGYEDTKLTIAWVDWTLRYEWLFYVSLPLLSRVLTRSRWLTFGLVAAALYLTLAPVRIVGTFDSRYLILFVVGGLAASLKLGDPRWGRAMRHPVTALVAVAALLGELFLFEAPFGPWQVVLLGTFFIPIALGNSLFGLLKHDASVFLGELSYSMYLMHPLVLYATFQVFGPRLLPVRGPESMLWMPALGLAVVLLSWATYSMVERPGINYGKRLSRRWNMRSNALWGAA